MSIEDQVGAEETSSGPQPPRRLTFRARPSRFLMVSIPVAFNVVALRVETSPVMNLNDSAVHLAMIRWARYQIGAGRIPLDGWFPNFGLGSSHFHHYQSFPHIVSGYLATIFGAQATFSWSLYLLLALWPISVYASMRIFGWDGWKSAAAAVVSPLVSSVVLLGYEHGAYTWRGYGTWAQLWGMWLLPLALALNYKAVIGRGSYVIAAFALGLTIMCHFQTGYLAVLGIGVCVILRRRGFVERFKRAVVVVGGGVLIAAWTLVPFLVDGEWTGRSEFGEGTFISDSYGARRVLSWLFTGRLFDDNRFPVVTALLLVGLLVCWRRGRRDDHARFLLGFGLFSLVLYFGRPTLGPLVKLLPIAGGGLMERYVIGVHLAGICFAGIGAEAIVRNSSAAARSIISRRRDASRFQDVPLPPARATALGVAVTSVVAVLGFIALLPAWNERWSYDSRGAELIRFQQSQDATDGRDVIALIDQARSLGSGRFYAGLRSNWGANYKVGSVPVYAVLASRDADAIGFTLRTGSFMTGIEPRFDETDASQYDVFGIRYLVLPSDRDPAVEADLIASRGRHRLWGVEGSGYFDLVDTVGAFPSDRMSLGRQMEVFLTSDLPSKKLYRTIDYAGRPSEPPTITGSVPTSGPGRVEAALVSPSDGVFAGDVDARRRSMVMLKSSFDPRWRVVVDGEPVTPQIVAPGYVGGVVPPGRHSILFLYVPFPRYGWLVGLGFLTAAALAGSSRLVRRRRGRARRPVAE